MKLYLLLALFTVVSILAGIGGGHYLKNQDAQAAAVEQNTEEIEAGEPVIFSLGQMMVPIYRARSVSYVMADIRLSLEGEATVAAAERYYDLLRAEALQTMVNFASLGHFNEATIDQAALSRAMQDNLNGKVFEDEKVKDVLFRHLIRQDANR